MVLDNSPISQSMNSQPTIGAVILAAGASTRMGTPKQLLYFKGRSLLRHTVEVAIAQECEPIVVVLGAYAEQIRNEVSLSQLRVVVVENQDWKKGMGASIRVGVNAVNNLSENLEAVILLLCDQPFCDRIINQLVSVYYTTRNPIIASEYAQTLGVPALFSHELFSELMNLDVEKGAKQVIQKYKHLVFSVPFEAGVIDVDTPEDYERLQSIN
jgi:molybdenum cofactor cytidylyltransferase